MEDSDRRVGVLAYPSRVRFRFVLPSLALAVLVPLPSRADAPAVATIDRVVAVVDDGVILRSEVVARARPLVRGQGKVDLAAVHKSVLEVMIEERLIGRRAKELHVTVSDAEITAAMDRVAQAAGVTREKLDAEVKRQGMTLAEYRAEIGRQLLEAKWTMIEVRPKVTTRPKTDKPTPEEERAFASEMAKRRAEAVDRLRAAAFVELR